MYMFWPKPSLFHFLALIVTNPTSPYFINKQGSVKGEMLRSRGQQRGGVYLHALVLLATPLSLLAPRLTGASDLLGSLRHDEDAVDVVLREVAVDALPGHECKHSVARPSWQTLPASQGGWLVQARRL